MTNTQEKKEKSGQEPVPNSDVGAELQLENIRFDLIAGIVVAGLIIPESMGIAGVAGVEPQHGLYAILIALFLYAIFGSGRRSVISTPSAMALLTASAIATLTLTAYEDVLAAVVTITFLTGLILLIMAVLRLGLLANFISYPVMKGFLFGLALTIIIGQVPKLLGIAKRGRKLLRATLEYYRFAEPDQPGYLGPVHYRGDYPLRAGRAFQEDPRCVVALYHWPWRLISFKLGDLVRSCIGGIHPCRVACVFSPADEP